MNIVNVTMNVDSCIIIFPFGYLTSCLIFAGRVPHSKVQDQRQEKKEGRGFAEYIKDGGRAESHPKTKVITFNSLSRL